jgi:hypothetical protein
VNFADSSFPTGAHEIAYYGNNRQELQDIKKVWDKDGIFNWKHGISLPENARDFEAKWKIAGQAPGAADSADFNADTDEEWNGEPLEMLINEEKLTDEVASTAWETYEPNPNVDFLGVQEDPLYGL